MTGRWNRHNHLAEKYYAWKVLRSRGRGTRGKLGTVVRVPPHLGLRDNAGSLWSGGESGTPPLAVGSWMS